MKINITLTFQILLTVIFIALKLDGVLQWKWIWVLSPIWIDFLIGIIFSVIILIANREKKEKYKPHIAGGKRLMWDAETNTMYGGCGEELTTE